MSTDERFKRSAEEYYSEKFRTFGESPQGVDWSSPEAQTNRFSALLNVFDKALSPSNTLLDYGCGYGLLSDYLQERGLSVSYIGYDLSAEMISHANQRRPGSWITKLPEGESYDYVVSSGTFNVKLAHPTESWRQYVQSELISLWSRTRRAFAVNFLPLPSAGYDPISTLFYVDPAEQKRWFEENLSDRVEVYRDYGPYDITFVIRKNELTGGA